MPYMNRPGSSFSISASACKLHLHQHYIHCVPEAPAALLSDRLFLLCDIDLLTGTNELLKL